MVKVILILLLTAGSMVSCRRSVRQSNDSGNASLATAQSQEAIDTAAVLNVLKFNKEDSLFIHVPNSTASSSDGITVFHARVVISSELPAFDFRAVLSVRPHDDVSKFGSYVIIYKNAKDTLGIRRIRLDSVDINVPALSSFQRALSFVDFNYDGYKDIHLSFTENTAGNTGCNHFLRYDSTLGQFQPDSVFESLFGLREIFIDEEERKIVEGGRIGTESYVLSEYGWNGTTYVLSAEESSVPSDDGGALITTRKELLDGSWIVVRSDTTLER